MSDQMKRPAPKVDSEVMGPTEEQKRRLAELSAVNPELTGNVKKGVAESPVASEEVGKAEPIKEPPDEPTELQVLTGKCAWDTSKNSWKDKFGVPHGVYPIDFGDLGEFMKRHGEITHAFSDSSTQLNAMLTLVWLSVRKEDCSETDLDKENYKYSRPAVGRMFGLTDGDVLVSIAMEILRLSGMEVDVASEEQSGNEGAGGESEGSVNQG